MTAPAVTGARAIAADLGTIVGASHMEVGPATLVPY